MRVYERKPWAGAPVAEKSRLDVICRERPFKQRIVLEVDLADCQVVTGSPPRVSGGQLAIGEHSKVISGQFHSHATSLVQRMRGTESRRSLFRAAEVIHDF